MCGDGERRKHRGLVRNIPMWPPLYCMANHSPLPPIWWDLALAALAQLAAFPLTAIAPNAAAIWPAITLTSKSQGPQTQDRGGHCLSATPGACYSPHSPCCTHYPTNHLPTPSL